MSVYTLHMIGIGYLESTLPKETIKCTVTTKITVDV